MMTNLQAKIIEFFSYLGCMKSRCCRIFSVDYITKFSRNHLIIFADSVNRLVIFLLIGTSPVLYEKLKVLYVHKTFFM